MGGALCQVYPFKEGVNAHHDTTTDQDKKKRLLFKGANHCFIYHVICEESSFPNTPTTAHCLLSTAVIMHCNVTDTAPNHILQAEQYPLANNTSLRRNALVHSVLR